MYNCQIVKYPHGYQVRLYDTAHELPPPGDDKLTLEKLSDLDVLHRMTKYSLEDPGHIFEMDQSDIDTWMENVVEQEQRSLRSSMGRTTNKVYYLARSNDWEWFFTLTFNPEVVDSFDYEACTKKLSNWFIVMRRMCPDMKYLVVPEQHKSGRWHFHGLFAGCDALGFVDSGKKTKDGEVIYNVGKYRLGFSTATRVRDPRRVTRYIGKYITKDLCAVTKGKKRYWCSRNLSQAEIEKKYYAPGELPVILEQLRDMATSVTSSTSEGLGATYYIELSEVWNDDKSQ